MDKTLKKNLIILTICFILSGILSIIYISSAEFDFINYRLYNGWAFFNNRFDIDFMPVTFRTYFNPLIDALNYLLIDKLNYHPYIYLFITGLKYGLFMFISYLIYDLLIIKNSEKNFLIISALIFTATSPIVIYSLNYGTTDMQTALLIMLALYLYLKNIFEKKENYSILFILSLLIGGAIGFKYTNFAFAMAFLICNIFFYKYQTHPIKNTIFMILGIIAGLIITDGFWLYKLWVEFQNPFFPYFNNIFHSKYANIDTLFITDYAHLHPKNLLGFLLAPLKNPIKPNNGTEICFFDIKIPLTFVLISVYIVLKKIFKTYHFIIQPKKLNLIICMTTATYYINLILFSQIRYVLPLFALSSLIIIILIYQLCSAKIFKNSAPDLFIILFLLIFILCFIQNNKFFIFLHNPLNWFILSVFIIYAVFIVINFMSEKFTNTKKKIYFNIVLCLIITVLTSYLEQTSFNFRNLKTTSFIKNMQIEDNANVICATMLTSFIIPKQNPKAHYIGFVLPLNFQYESFWMNETPYHNMLYKNDFLENKLKEIFAENKPLYFMYSYQGIAWNLDKSLYKKAIKYYSQNQIQEIINCQVIPVSFFDHYTSYGDYLLCKLK